MDLEIKRLMRNLGDAINETMGDSPKINASIQSIRDAGYEVFLIIEAKVGFNRKSKGKPESPTAEKGSERVRLRVTNEDVKFLKSLKISVDAED